MGDWISVILCHISVTTTTGITERLPVTSKSKGWVMTVFIAVEKKVKSHFFSDSCFINYLYTCFLSALSFFFPFCFLSTIFSLDLSFT